MTTEAWEEKKEHGETTSHLPEQTLSFDHNENALSKAVINDWAPCPATGLRLSYY